MRYACDTWTLVFDHRGKHLENPWHEPQRIELLWVDGGVGKINPPENEWSLRSKFCFVHMSSFMFLFGVVQLEKSGGTGRSLNYLNFCGKLVVSAGDGSRVPGGSHEEEKTTDNPPNLPQFVSHSHRIPWGGGLFTYWLVVSNIFLFSPGSLEKWSNLTIIFFRWVGQPPTSLHLGDFNGKLVGI